MKKFVLIFCFLIMATTSVFAMPFSRRSKGMPGMGMSGPPKIGMLKNLNLLNKKLNLSDKQLQKIDKINLKYEKTYLNCSKILVPKHLEIKLLTLEEPINYKKVRQTIESTTPIMIDFKIAGIKHFAEIKNTLTTKQKLKLKQMLMQGKPRKMKCKKWK
jgi:Spy/CpxP family protein refolding chaperone